MAYEKYLDTHKVSERKLKQKVETPSENGDKYTIDGKKKRFVDSDLPTTYEKLSKLSKEDLVQYGINTRGKRRRFKKYVEYVRKVEKQLAKLENQFSQDRKVLEVIMNEIFTSTNAISVKKASLKNRIRMTRKLLKQLNGQFEKLTDIVRGSLTFSNHRDLYKALRLLKANPAVQQMHVKDFLNVRDSSGNFDLNRETSHKSGFRYINVKIRLKSGRVVELQLHLKEIHKAATKRISIPTGILQSIKFSRAQKALFKKTAKQIKRNGGPSIEFPDFSQARQTITEQHIYNVVREIRARTGKRTKTERELIINLQKLSKIVYRYSWEVYKARNK
jgi:hypothetical protein